MIVNTVKPKEQCAQTIISRVEDQRAQINIPESNTEVIEVEIHAERNGAQHMLHFEEAQDLSDAERNDAQHMVHFEEAQDLSDAERNDAQHMVHFEEVQDLSDAGSLITQAPQSNPIHATINTLSTWISAVVSTISLQCYEKLVETDAILTPMKAMQIELEAANKSDMRVHGMCSLELSVHGLLINIDAVVVDLNCQGILGMDILGDASKLPFILDLVDGTLSGGGYETIQLHRFHAATECFAETIDPVCIPPHSEVMLWAKLKTNNGGRGPTAGVVLALQSLVQEFGLLVGRSLVRADAEDWKVPILLYNSDPCTKKSTDCTCNPVIIPGHTRIVRVEEIQAIFYFFICVRLLAHM